MTFGVWKGRRSPKGTVWVSLESLDDVVNPVTGERLGDQDDVEVAVDIERRISDIVTTDETIQRTEIATDIGDQLVEVVRDEDKMSVREIALVQAGAAATLAATGADEELIEETVAAAAVESKGHYTLSTEDLSEKLKVVKDKVIELYHGLITMVEQLMARMFDGYGIVAKRFKTLQETMKGLNRVNDQDIQVNNLSFIKADAYCVENPKNPKFDLASYMKAIRSHSDVGDLSKAVREAASQMHSVVESAMRNILSNGEDESIKDLNNISVHLESDDEFTIGTKTVSVKNGVLSFEEDEMMDEIVSKLAGGEYGVRFTRVHLTQAIDASIAEADKLSTTVTKEFKAWMSGAKNDQRRIDDLVRQAEEKHPKSGAISCFKKMYQADSKMISTLSRILREDMTAFHAQFNYLRRLVKIVAKEAEPDATLQA